MHADAHRLRMVLLEMQIKGFNDLVECRFGRPVRVPPAALVILYRPEARRDVGPFRHVGEKRVVVVDDVFALSRIRALTLSVHPLRRQEPREVLNDKEV